MVGCFVSFQVADGCMIGDRRVDAWVDDSRWGSRGSSGRAVPSPSDEDLDEDPSDPDREAVVDRKVVDFSVGGIFPQ